MKVSALILFVRLLLVTGLAAAAGATAQETTVTQAPPAASPAPLLRKPATTESRPADPTGSFFSAGPLSLHPHLSFSSVYGLGLPADSGRHVASMVYTTTPGLTVDLGQHWTVDYSPTWVDYTAAALHDTHDQAASLQGAGFVGDWATTLTGNYSKSSPILFETGKQTPQQTWVSQLGASYSFASGVNLSASAGLNLRSTPIAPFTRDWTTMNWLTKVFPFGLETGLGLGGGYTAISSQPDAITERYMGRFNWTPTDKLKLGLDGGLETRHTRSSTAKALQTPILSATLSYRPTTTTTLTAGASRTVNTSYFNNQVTVGSGWNLGWEQRLLRHFYLRMSYGVRQTAFDATTTLIPVLTQPDPTAGPVVTLLPFSQPGRSDRTESIDARLSTQLRGHWTLAASYRRARNSSSQAGFTFVTTQVGFELSCRY